MPTSDDEERNNSKQGKEPELMSDVSTNAHPSYYGAAAYYTSSSPPMTQSPHPSSTTTYPCASHWCVYAPGIIVISIAALLLIILPLVVDGEEVKVASMLGCILVLYIIIYGSLFLFAVPVSVTRTAEGFEMKMKAWTAKIAVEEVQTMEALGCWEVQRICDMYRGQPTGKQKSVYIKAHRCCRSMVFTPVCGGDQFVAENVHFLSKSMTGGGMQTAV
eukprot:GHVQ01043137.1.p1 GENE.GHVQ01043137.1~~GHVQ01043137.1.p1  ORF type:complete len:218 (+),score=41.01 GHVQ01043137.1:589-1242(+)